MKNLSLFIIVMSVVVFAQQDVIPVDRDDDAYVNIGNADWAKGPVKTMILAISGDSLNVNEAWMHLLPGGKTAILNTDNSAMDYENLEAPCRVEISYFGKGRMAYIESIRFLKQFTYSSDGYIIGDNTADTAE